MIRLYRTKVVEVQAVQWNGLNHLTDLPSLIPVGEPLPWRPPSGNDLVLDTPDGAITAQPGDFIVRHRDGALAVCPPGLFLDTYELAR